jgi:hypothetical protein
VRVSDRDRSQRLLCLPSFSSSPARPRRRCGSPVVVKRFMHDLEKENGQQILLSKQIAHLEKLLNEKKVALHCHQYFPHICIVHLYLFIHCTAAQQSKSPS